MSVCVCIYKGVCVCVCVRACGGGRCGQLNFILCSYTYHSYLNSIADSCTFIFGSGWWE